MDFVNLHGDTASIVPDLDFIPLCVNVDLNLVLTLIVLIVISRIHQDLIYTYSLIDNTYQRFCTALERRWPIYKQCVLECCRRPRAFKWTSPRYLHRCQVLTRCAQVEFSFGRCFLWPLHQLPSSFMLTLCWSYSKIEFILIDANLPQNMKYEIISFFNHWQMLSMVHYRI